MIARRISRWSEPHEHHEYNRNAWNLQSEEGCRWSTPYPDEVIDAAKAGEWSVILTPNKPVPAKWFPSYPDLSALRLLALASGGGQQVPIFAAAGADVTSFDASDVQLQKDEETCAKHGLKVRVMQGDMADLSGLEDEEFDLIFQSGVECLCGVSSSNLAGVPSCASSRRSFAVRVHEPDFLPL